MDNQTHVDPETARLLAELGGQAGAKSERQVLLDEAAALGLKVALNIGTNKLKALIGEAREAAAAPAAGAGPADGDTQLSATTEADLTVTVVNRSGQMYSIVGVSFKPNENVTLTGAQLKNERLMQKIEHMIRLKVFFRVAAQ
jgi:hypothetical protein